MAALIVAFAACGNETKCGDKAHANSDATSTAKPDSTTVATAAFACPMHPKVTGKAGDTCPECGMDLEPAK